MARKGDANFATFFVIGIGAFLFMRGKGVASPISPSQQALSVSLPRSPNTGTSSYNVWVQESLNRIFPEANLNRDGVIGPITRQWIMKFQEMWGISVDGIVGPETDYSLRSAQGMTGYIEQPYAYTAQNTWY